MPQPLEHGTSWDGEFQWDEINLEHAAAHGVTPRLVREVANRDPLLFEDDGQGHSASHLMIGPNGRGRFWSIVLLELAPGLWRPITGWRNTNTERDLYRESI